MRTRTWRTTTNPEGGDLDTTEEELFILAWRSEQLSRLGLPSALANLFAGLVDWHDVAKLVERGCTPDVALRIAR
jgi:hypothetical protein